MLKSAIAVVLTLTSLVGMPVLAASFDCNKSSTYQENEICKDSRLSQLDETMNSQYKLVLAEASMPDTVRDEQRAWLTQRNQCFSNPCLHSSMTERLEQLKLSVSVPEPVIEQVEVLNEPTEPAPVVSIQDTTESLQTTSNHQDAYSTVKEDGNPESTQETHHTNTPKNEKSYLPLKIAAVILLVISITSIYLHHQGKLTIYYDYTDAVFTSLIPLSALIFYWLLTWLELPRPYPAISGLAIGILLFIVVIRSTIAANGFNINFIMALTTKLTMITVFYAIIATIMASGTVRKQSERQAAFASRQRRENRE